MRTPLANRCEVCGAAAAVFMRGVSLCARCGLERSVTGHEAAQANRRAALFLLLSTGLIARVLVGTVAVAAVSGVAIAALGSPAGEKPAAVAEANGLPEPVVAAIHEVSPVPGVDDLVASAHRAAENAQRLSEAMQAWARCVSAEAAEDNGAGFNPVAACGPRPNPVDYGLGSGPPGHSGGQRGAELSESAPGRGETSPGRSEKAGTEAQDDDNQGRDDSLLEVDGPIEGDGGQDQDGDGGQGRNGGGQPGQNGDGRQGQNRQGDSPEE